MRLNEPLESFLTSSAHRLRNSHVGRFGHWVEIIVLGECSDAEFALIRRLAQAADTRRVAVRRHHPGVRRGPGEESERAARGSAAGWRPRERLSAARRGELRWQRPFEKITMSPSRDIPFNKLVLSQSNVRRVKAGISIEQLAESIAQRTLLQSLNVRAVSSMATATRPACSRVPAGGRRYRALELLVKQKRMAEDAARPLRCSRSGANLAEDDSLAENDDRVELHPLDQFRAFQALRDRGMTEAGDRRAALRDRQRSSSSGCSSRPSRRSSSMSMPRTA